MNEVQNDVMTLKIVSKWSAESCFKVGPTTKG
jgi:hypothetical protein